MQTLCYAVNTSHTVQRDIFEGAKFSGKQAKASRIIYRVFNFQDSITLIELLLTFLLTVVIDSMCTVALTSRFTLEVGLPVSRVLSRAS